MNVVSISLFGSSPVYCLGAIENAKLYPQMLPGWKVIFFCGSDVPQETLEKLRQHGAEIRPPPDSIANGLFWRFSIMDDPKVERAVFRDADSRPNPREKSAILEWPKHKKPFLSLADHPHHYFPLDGGLWGCDKTLLKSPLEINFTERMRKLVPAQSAYDRALNYNSDRSFLSEVVWPVAKRTGYIRFDSCNRDIFKDALPFPCKTSFDDLSFVGEIFDEKGQPDWHTRMLRINYLSA